MPTPPRIRDPPIATWRGSGPAGGQPDEDAEEWGGAWINLSSAAACAGLVSVLRGPHPITLPRGFDRIKAPTLQLGPLSGLAHFFPQWGFIESFDGRGGSTGQGSGAFSPSTGRDTGEPGRLKNIPYGCHLARDLRVCVRGTTRGTRVTWTRVTRQCLPTTRWGQDNRLQRKQRLGVPRVGDNRSAPSSRTYHSWLS